MGVGVGEQADWEHPDWVLHRGDICFSILPTGLRDAQHPTDVERSRDHTFSTASVIPPANRLYPRPQPPTLNHPPGYVVYDTQMIVERCEAGDTDSLRHALDVFVDFCAIFVRLLVSLRFSAIFSASVALHEVSGRLVGWGGDGVGQLLRQLFVGE